MSKIVYICSRHQKGPPYSHHELALLSQRLTPDNIEANPPKIIDNDGVLVGIVNPADVLSVKHSSVCMGHMFGEQEDWWQPNTTVPDGTYALFRSNADTVEIITDTLASRTVWYALNEEVFIASTSQRAIVMLLKRFELNEEVFPWMISSGTLGPGLSWDQRINMLPDHSRLILNRNTWTLEERKKSLNYATNSVSQDEHEDNLKKSIELTFSELELNFNQWKLPLSGGVDSRAILLMLKDRPGLTTITWGLQSSLHDKNNDAFVAKQLAEHFHVAHEYFETDIPRQSIDEIFTRFIVAGEGRIDNISGYMDGFKIWKTLYDNGVQGIIRGDEAFGCYPVKSTSGVFRNMRFLTLEDFDNTDNIREYIQNTQQRPAKLLKTETESLEEWRDRLNREYEFPVIFAALNDLKLAYVEIINPLISRNIVSQAMTLPDNLRDDKKLFRHIVQTMCPEIRFAKNVAIEQRGNILRRKDVVNVITKELKSDHAQTLFHEKLLNEVLCQMVCTDANKPNNKNALLPRLIRKAKAVLSLPQKNNIDMNNVAFRLYLISKMSRLLSEDAQVLNNHQTAQQ